jgi:hypothetical protein
MTAPTAAAHIENQTTSLALNFLEKGNIHAFGLENNQKQFYDVWALRLWDDVLLSVVPKKRPEAATSGLTF